MVRAKCCVHWNEATDRQTDSSQGQSGGQDRAEIYRATDRQTAVRDRVVASTELKYTERQKDRQTNSSQVQSGGQYRAEIYRATDR